MANVVLRAIKSTANAILAPIGLQISKAGSGWHEDTRNFIPFEETARAAQGAGFSIADYVDTVMNQSPGSSQATVDLMAAAGVFANAIDTVVEIGPGTGRYLEKTIKAAHPRRYEIYETAGPWLTYLAQNYDVVAQETDGFSLSKTPDMSADLVHAHKVFNTVTFMMSCCYWNEMVRVVKPGGWAVFDIMTERCLEGDALSVWAKSGIRNGSFPTAMPRELATRFFGDHGFSLKASHIVPMRPGVTELMIFQRN